MVGGVGTARKIGAPSAAASEVKGMEAPSARTKLVKWNDGFVEGGEVAAQDGPDAARVVGAKVDDAAGDDGVLWQEEFVVGVTG